MNKKFCELRIVVGEQTKINMLLCVLLANEPYPWFYETHINVQMYSTNSYNYVFAVSDSQDSSYHQYMDSKKTNSYSDFKKKREPLILIKNRLLNGFYSEVWVDEYYFRGSCHYKSEHFVHKIIVYGFDDARKIIKAIHFNPNIGQLKLDISYGEFINAFMNGKKYYYIGGSLTTLTETIVSFIPKMNYHNKIKFNLKRFCGELGNYIFSRVNPEKERMQFFNIDITEEYYGFSIYNKLFDILNSPNENFNIAFTGLYNFMLHKGFLEERFIYINNLYNHPDNFLSLIEKYHEVVILMQEAININLKYNILEKKRIASFNKNPVYLSKLKKIFMRVKELEYDLLPKIYFLLNTLPPNRNNPGLSVNKDKYNIQINEDTIEVVFPAEEMLCRIDVLNSPSEGISEFLINEEEIFYMENSQCTKVQTLEFPPIAVKYIRYHSSAGKAWKNNIEFNFYKLPDKILWTFDTWDHMDWQDWNHLEKLQIEDRHLSAVSTGDDPYFVMYKNFYINMDHAKTAKITFRHNNRHSKKADIFFISSGTENWQGKRFVCASNYKKFIEHIVDLSEVAAWNGKLKRFRFDPTEDCENGCRIDIKSIELTKDMPVYSSSSSFCNTQGVNGWTNLFIKKDDAPIELKWDPETEQWFYPKNPSLNIKKEEQTASCKDNTPVRRFTCPVGGKYTLSANLENKTQDDLVFLIKLNQEKIFSGNFTDTFHLEKTLSLSEEDTLDFIMINPQDRITPCSILITMEKE